MARYLNLRTDSRYKDTPVYDRGGLLEFALWEPPKEFQTVSANAILHTVSAFEIGELDLIAVNYYGPGYESAWWVIAQVNAIIDAETEMYPGMTLYIPPLADVIQFQAREGNVTIQQQV